MRPPVFALCAAGLLLTAIVAFWPPYFSRLLTLDDPRLHAHVVFVSLWMAALIGQPLLVHTRRIAGHRTVGRLSYGLAPLVVISAVLLAHTRLAGVPSDAFEDAARFFYLPVQAVLLFSASYLAAIVFRRRRPVHEAFMLGSALALLDPIAARVLQHYTRLPDDHWLYDIIAFAISGSILLVLAARANRGDARWAYGTLLGVFALFQIGWLTVSYSAAWRAWAQWFASLPLSGPPA